MSDSNGDASLPTGAEMRARARDKSGTDLDTQILNDNVIAAINASERLHMLAKKKLREQGLAPAATATVNSGNGARPVEVVATDLSEDLLEALAKGMVPVIRQWIADAVNPLAARLDAMEKHKGLAPFVARLAQLEAKPSLQYEGTWNEAKTYSCGALVTFQGGLWHCEDTNMGVRPGAGSSSWKLAVKRGRADR
jgi:hypothetical protein